MKFEIFMLKILETMDYLWKSEGLDLKMSLYPAIATGVDHGIVEPILNSLTVADIVKLNGSPISHFRDDSLSRWLESQNPDGNKFYLKNYKK